MKTWVFLVAIVLVFLLGYWVGKYQNSTLTKGGILEKPAKTILQDTQWVGSDEFILFDTAVVEVYRNTGFKKSFADFKVPVYGGKKMAIDYKSHRIAREYKTVITSEYEQTAVNFAGHYILCSWRCGAPCQNFAIVDVLNGKVYKGMIATSGYNYQPDSKLLIFNPPDSLGWYSLMELYTGAPEYYLWENDRFKSL